MPAWSAFAPIRNLMTQHADVIGSQGSGIINRIDKAIDFASNLIATNPAYAGANRCDLIISCDTAIAHLAGAMGKPTWIILRHMPHWIWMMDRADSPWYPSIRLFRQKTPGDWNEPFNKVASELKILQSSTKKDGSE